MHLKIQCYQILVKTTLSASEDILIAHLFYRFLATLRHLLVKLLTCQSACSKDSIFTGHLNTILKIYFRGRGSIGRKGSVRGVVITGL